MKSRAVRWRGSSTWELFSRLFSAELGPPRGLGKHSGPVGRAGEVGEPLPSAFQPPLSLERQTLSWPGPSLCKLHRVQGGGRGERCQGCNK